MPFFQDDKISVAKSKRPGNVIRPTVIKPAHPRKGVPPYLSRQLEKDQWIASRAQKQFVAWDGEGYDDETGTHHYMLFGYRGDYDMGDGNYIHSYSLGTKECLDFMWSVGAELTNVYHVAFGFSYDVDQILKDLPDSTLRELTETNEVRWGGYKIRFIPRKFFTLSKGRKQGITIYDVMTFFHSSMIGACREYIPDDEDIPFVERGKAQRGTFTFERFQTDVLPYWEREGDLLVRLMSELRRSMVSAGINLTKWHGPGAIADSLIRRERIDGHIQRSRVEQPMAVTEATAFAYFGGRFESFMLGRIPHTIHAYDIRSAYPAALSVCPILEGGEWVHVSRTDGLVREWGLYRVTCEGHSQFDSALHMGPLPNRLGSGVVTFGLHVEGWYYGHEVKAAQITGWRITVHEGWYYDSSDTSSAFTFLHEMYLQRADWKRAGNPAQLAAKLGINSIYGKLSQLTGWDEENLLPPKFHQQWYAGQTTSWCRARLWVAMSQCPDAIVACETDGIYSLEKLSVPLSNRLGDWEYETYDEAVYIQSGVYFMRKGDEWEKAKLRGLSANTMGMADVMRHLDDLSPLETTVHRYGSLTGYIGRENHHKWFDQTRKIEWGGNGKRAHMPSMCPQCQDGYGPHRTSMTHAFASFSHPRKLPWVTGENADWLMEQEYDHMVD